MDRFEPFAVVLVLATGFLIGCSRAKEPALLSGNLREYDYRHTESTGVNQFVVAQGKEVPIQFSKDSDQRELKSLLDHGRDRDLLPLYNPASDPIAKERIVLVGELLKGTHMTPTGDDYPPPEPYREFRLVQWRVVSAEYQLRSFIVTNPR